MDGQVHGFRRNHLGRGRFDRGKGLTLIELLVTIAVIAILATIGIPSFQQLLKNNRVDAQARELVALVNFARSEALRRNGNVGVAIVNDNGGWSATVCTGTCPGIPSLRNVEHNRVSLSADVQLTFTNRGYLDAWDEPDVAFFLEHDACSGGRQRRSVVVERTGQLTISPVGCGS